MSEKYSKTINRLKDTWGVLLFLLIIGITYFHISGIFKDVKISLKGFTGHVKIYSLICACITTLFAIVLFLFNIVPWVSSFTLFVVVPSYSLGKALLLRDGGEMIEIEGVYNFCRIFSYLIMVVLLLCIYFMYIIDKIRYTKFMLEQGLKYARSNIVACFKLILFILLKLYTLLFIMNIIEYIIVENVKKGLLLPNLISSTISLFTVIGTMKVSTALLLTNEIARLNNVQPQSLWTMLGMVPTIYVNSFLYPLTTISKYLTPLDHDTNLSSFKNKLSKYHNIVIRVIGKLTFGFLSKRSDFVLYYSLLYDENYFTSFKNSSKYIERKNINKMISDKVVYYIFIPSFFCFSLMMKDVLGAGILGPDVKANVCFVPALITSIVFIEFINSRFEFLIFIYADKPSLINDNDSKLFKFFLETSSTKNEDTPTVTPRESEEEVDDKIIIEEINKYDP